MKSLNVIKRYTYELVLKRSFKDHSFKGLECPSIEHRKDLVKGLIDVDFGG